MGKLVFDPEMKNIEQRAEGVFCGDMYDRPVAWDGTRNIPVDLDTPGSISKKQYCINFYTTLHDEMRIITGTNFLPYDFLDLQERLESDWSEWIFLVRAILTELDQEFNYLIVPVRPIDDKLRAKIEATELNDLRDPSLYRFAS